MTATVRVRGIYATALTRIFADAGHGIVDASAPIRRRFNGGGGDDGDDGDPFESAAPDVRIWTTEDRQGVGASGDPEGVAEVRDRLRDVGLDALTWSDPTPPGAVFDGRVTETLGGGAVVSLRLSDGTREGYLPYGSVEERVETGDAVRVQVRESAAPWTDRRPELSGELRAAGGLVALEPGSGTRVDIRDDEIARELAGMVDLLGLEPPEGWRAVWQPSAADADRDALESGLRRAVEAVEGLGSAASDTEQAGGLGVVDDPDHLRDEPLATPTAGVWVWFGRESRFALDDRRRAVTATMPGHHRVKAGSSDASVGVDLAEALCEPEPDAAFPFGVVTDAFGPTAGDALRIDHGKPDGRCFALGEGTVTGVAADGSVTVEREMTGGGTYDGLDVPREAGDVAETSLKEGRWWYPTTYRGADGTLRGTYVNVCTPVEVFPDAARYVDLHVDVIKHADGTVERVDDDVLDESVAAGDTPEALAEKARSVAAALEKAL